MPMIWAHLDPCFYNIFRRKPAVLNVGISIIHQFGSLYRRIKLRIITGVSATPGDFRHWSISPAANTGVGSQVQNKAVGQLSGRIPGDLAGNG